MVSGQSWWGRRGDRRPDGELGILKSRSPVRALVMPAAFAAGLALAGCNSEQMAFVNSSKANKPIPEKLVSEINAKDMDVQSPILVRLFEQRRSSRSGNRIAAAVFAAEDLSDLPLVGRSRSQDSRRRSSGP